MKQANGMKIVDGKQVQAFAQAKTKKRIAEMLGDRNTHNINEYWSWTWNDGMKAVGGDQEGLWVSKDSGWHTEYKDYKKIK